MKKHSSNFIFLAIFLAFAQGLAAYQVFSGPRKHQSGLETQSKISDDLQESGAFTVTLTIQLALTVTVIPSTGMDPNGALSQASPKSKYALYKEIKQNREHHSRAVGQARFPVTVKADLMMLPPWLKIGWSP